MFFLDLAPLPINGDATISGHKADLAPLPIDCGAIISDHKLDLAPLPINCGATISGHKLDLAPLPINCGATISDHKGWSIFVYRSFNSFKGIGHLVPIFNILLWMGAGIILPATLCRPTHPPKLRNLYAKMDHP